MASVMMPSLKSWFNLKDKLSEYAAAASRPPADRSHQRSSSTATIGPTGDSRRQEDLGGGRPRTSLPSDTDDPDLVYGIKTHAHDWRFYAMSLHNDNVAARETYVSERAKYGVV
jgi:hypothetical protein